MRTEHERLLDILEAIERIEKYAIRGKAEIEYSGHFKWPGRIKTRILYK